MDKQIKEYLKKYDELYDQLYALEDKAGYGCKNENLNKKIEKKENEIDDFTDVFAKYIFDLYSKKNPKVVDRFDKKVCRFDEAFGTDYSKIDKLLKKSIIGLFSNSGKYKLK